MSTWNWCDKPEPHGGHEWSAVYFDEDLPMRDYFMCPGVKDGPQIQRYIVRRNNALHLLAGATEDLLNESVRQRRTPHQYTVNDDNAPAEEPRED